jgi:hypothetical protein
MIAIGAGGADSLGQWEKVIVFVWLPNAGLNPDYSGIKTKWDDLVME